MGHHPDRATVRLLSSNSRDYVECTIRTLLLTYNLNDTHKQSCSTTIRYIMWAKFQCTAVGRQGLGCVGQIDQQQL